MGSCISKCKPKKKIKEDRNHVHDKLVISQDPVPSTIPDFNPTDKEKRALSSAPSSSASSLSSFSRNSKCTSISSSSSCSTSSHHALISRDGSFSNEFLWSCVKENPHVIGQDPGKNVADKVHPRNVEPSSIIISTKVKQSVQEKPMIHASTPKKRARASSPTIVRQKSFRKDQNSVSSGLNRGLRSPSPSRRFNVENHNKIFPTNGIGGRSPIVSKANSVSSALSGVRRDTFRPPSLSPNRDYLMKNSDPVRKKEVLSQHISTKIGGVDVEEIRYEQEMDTVMEDVNNPLIALDCFIFL